MTTLRDGRDEEYREYCRCWWVYLDRVGRDAGFRVRLAERLPCGVRVWRWPGVWPEVEYVFEGRGETPAQARRNFVEAVRHAEAESC